MEMDDKEIEAMRELYRILKPFDRAAQERIAGYVGNRLAAEASQEEHAMWLGAQQAMNQQEAAAAQTPPPAPLNYAIGQLRSHP